MKLVKEIIIYLLLAVVVLLIRYYLFTPVIVRGDSMNPTLQQGDYLISERWKTDYDYFDIVVVKVDNASLIKRIIGKPGDHIKFIDNQLYINDIIIDENFSKENTKDFELNIDQIPNNHYFVMGDNRSNSLDSRVFGPVHKDDLKGIVRLSIWPFKIVN
jgi:signal peptidase I